MARQMTPTERTTFKGWFPNLDVNAAVVTGEVDAAYNCISWTVGVTNKWLWPGASIANFDTFYRQWGFVRSGNGPIAAWGSSTSSMTHGCISGPGHGPRWESKCGQSLRIQHGLTELEGATYGRVVAFYSKGSAAAPFAELRAASPGQRPKARRRAKADAAMKLSKSEKTALTNDTSSIPDEVQSEFKRAFEAWRKSWFAGSLAIDSNPYSRAHGSDFDKLVALGPQIMPLVVEKLVDEQNFFALSLYDAIQSDARLIVQHEPDDPRIMEGEQGRAARVVKAWLAR